MRAAVKKSLEAARAGIGCGAYPTACINMLKVPIITVNVGIICLAPGIRHNKNAVRQTRNGNGKVGPYRRIGDRIIPSQLERDDVGRQGRDHQVCMTSWAAHELAVNHPLRSKKRDLIAPGGGSAEVFGLNPVQGRTLWTEVRQRKGVVLESSGGGGVRKISERAQVGNP